MKSIRKQGGYPAVVVCYAKYKDINKCMGLIGNLIDVFANESKRYFTNIIDMNIFQKLFNAIALLMMQEKQGVRNLTYELSEIVYQEESGRLAKKMLNHAISWLQESHIIGYASKAIDWNFKQIKDNCRWLGSCMYRTMVWYLRENEGRYKRRNCRKQNLYRTALFSGSDKI